MYGSEEWYIAPILFVPSSLLWLCFDALFDRFHISERLANKFGWKKRTVEKWVHRINFFISLIITFFVIMIISALIGFDLFNWKRIK